MKDKTVVICFLIGLTLGILLAGAGFYMYRLDCRIRQAISETQMLSEHLEEALTFEDTESMTRILSLLKSDPSVVFGGAYNSQGKLAAYYCPKGTVPRSGPIDYSYMPGCSFGRGYVKIAEPVIFDGERTGTVCVHYKLFGSEKIRLPERFYAAYSR